jgi:hypothetical protein
MKTLDWSVETLDRECNSTGLCIFFISFINQSSERNMADIKPGRRERTNFIFL